VESLGERIVLEKIHYIFEQPREEETPTAERDCGRKKTQEETAGEKKRDGRQSGSQKTRSRHGEKERQDTKERVSGDRVPGIGLFLHGRREVREEEKKVELRKTTTSEGKEEP